MPRNSGGTYSLPAGNPVVTGTPVSSTWANDTLSDLKTEMTDSLSRSGKGGMSAPLELYAGSQALPGLTFSGDTDNGLYLKAANSIALSLAAADVLEFAANLVKFSGTAPAFRFNESDGAANNKLWDVIATGEDLKFRALLDDLTPTDWLTVTRTAGVVDSIVLSATAITLNGFTPSSSGLFVLASDNTITGRNTISAGTPSLLWYESDGAANNRYWAVEAGSEQFAINLYNDALNSASPVMVVNRTANVVDSIGLTGTTISLTGSVYALGLTEVQHTTPQLRFNETDAGANEKIWEFRASGGDLFLYTDTDAGAADGVPMAFVRTGTTVDSITLTATLLSMVGVLQTSAGIELGHASDTTLSRVAAGRVAVEGLELGYRGLPAASVTTGAFVAADAGKCVNASGGVTVPNNTMAAGDVVVIDNQSGAPITITATITTLTLAGSASTGNRTLAANGIATIKFRSATSALISGTGLT